MMPNNRLPENLRFDTPPGRLGLVSMILRCMMVKTEELVELIEMRKTDSFGETKLVPDIPSSS